MSFLNNVLGSVVGSLVIVMATALLSTRFKRALTAMAAAFLRVDVKYVFRDPNDARKDLEDAFMRSDNVRVFAGRGIEFQRDTYFILLNGFHGRRPHVQVLLPDPLSPPRGTDWIEYREQELTPVDPSFAGGTLRRQIEGVLEFLRPRVDEHLEVRTYDAPHFGRIILTDDYLFLNAYANGKHGRDSAVIQYGRGEVYNFFDRLFTMIWEDSKDRVLTRGSA